LFPGLFWQVWKKKLKLDWDKDFSTSEIGFSTFFEKGPKNAGFTTLKFRKNKISKFMTF
jgi:hypothetical protein